MIESRYAFIDRIPDSLFDAVVNNGHGMLRPRTDGILKLRDELLSGRVPAPESLVWPAEALRAKLLSGLARSGVPRGRLYGLLSAIDWRRSAELRKVLAGLPPVRSLLNQLGRRSAPEHA